MRIALGTLALTALLATPSSATGCPLVTDPTGDATGPAPQVALLNDETLDIVSGDVDSDSSTLTVVLRVDDLRDDLAHTSRGAVYGGAFSIAETSAPRFYVEARRSPYHAPVAYVGVRDEAFARDFVGTVVGPASVVFDDVADEITITASLSVFQAFTPMATGATLRDPVLATHTTLAVPEVGHAATVWTDGAASSGTYALEDPGCI